MQPNLADKEEQVHMEAGYLDTSWQSIYVLIFFREKQEVTVGVSRMDGEKLSWESILSARSAN